jgi:hypothetical protein
MKSAALEAERNAQKPVKSYAAFLQVSELPADK